MIGIRDWAKKKGYKDEDVLYDPATKKVSIKGLGEVAGTMKNGSMMVNPYEMDNRKQKSDIDTASVSRQGALDNYNKLLNTQYTPGEFKYDQSTDPAYTAALERARGNIERGLQQNAEYMNERGLLNSTITLDRGNQIVSSEMNRLSTEIAPQLEERAYNRYRDDETRRQSSWQDMVRSAGTVYGLTNENYNQLLGQAEREKQGRMQQAQYLTNLYGTRVNPTLDPAGMERQVAGMKTASEREMDMKQRNADRDYSLAREKATSSAASGDSASMEVPAPPNKMSVEDAQKILNDGSLIFKNQYDGTIALKDKQGVINAINSYNLSATERKSLFNSYGLYDQARLIDRDPMLTDAVKRPDIVIDKLETMNLSDAEFERKLIYYGLWDYYFSN